jgi:hypothetical protein
MGEITMPTKAQLPVLAARVAVSVARERLAPVRLASLDDVPPAASALTTGWLTAALCRGVPEAAVADVEIVGGSDGTSSRRALLVTYNAAGQHAGLPTKGCGSVTPPGHAAERDRPSASTARWRARPRDRGSR